MTKRLLAIGALACALTAQNPTCNKCSATYISSDELQAYLQRGPAGVNNAVLDQQVRALDVGKSHVDIGVVYRNGTQSAGSAVAEHDQVSEVYHILDGSATLV